MSSRGRHMLERAISQQAALLNAPKQSDSHPEAAGHRRVGTTATSASSGASWSAPSSGAGSSLTALVAAQTSSAAILPLLTSPPKIVRGGARASNSSPAKARAAASGAGLQQSSSLTSLGQAPGEDGWGGSEHAAARPLPLAFGPSDRLAGGAGSSSLPPHRIGLASIGHGAAAAAVPPPPQHSALEALPEPRASSAPGPVLAALSAPEPSSPPRAAVLGQAIANWSSPGSPAAGGQDLTAAGGVPMSPVSSKPGTSLPGTPYKDRRPRGAPSSANRSVQGSRVNLYDSGVLDSKQGTPARNGPSAIGMHLQFGSADTVHNSGGEGDDSRSERSATSGRRAFGIVASPASASGASRRRGSVASGMSSVISGISGAVRTGAGKSGLSPLPPRLQGGSAGRAPTGVSPVSLHGSTRAKRMLQASQSSASIGLGPSPSPLSATRPAGVEAAAASATARPTTRQAQTGAAAEGASATSSSASGLVDPGSAVSASDLFAAAPPETVVRTRRQAAQEALALTTHRPQEKAARLNEEGKKIGVRFVGATPKTTATSLSAREGAISPFPVGGLGLAAVGQQEDEDEDMDEDEEEQQQRGQQDDEEDEQIASNRLASATSPQRAGVKRPRPVSPAGAGLGLALPSSPAHARSSPSGSHLERVLMSTVAVNTAAGNGEAPSDLVGGVAVPCGQLPPDADLLVSQFGALDQAVLMLKKKGRAGLSGGRYGSMEASTAGHAGLSPTSLAQALTGIPSATRLTAMPILAPVVQQFTRRDFTRVHLAQVVGMAPGCFVLAGLRLGPDGEYLGPASLASGPVGLTAGTGRWQLVIDSAEAWPKPEGAATAGSSAAGRSPSAGSSLARLSPPTDGASSSSTGAGAGAGASSSASPAAPAGRISAEARLTVRRTAFTEAVRAHYARAHAAYLRSKGCTGPSHALWPQPGMWAKGFDPAAVPKPAAVLPSSTDGYEAPASTSAAGAGGLSSLTPGSPTRAPALAHLRAGTGAASAVKGSTAAAAGARATAVGPLITPERPVAGASSSGAGASSAGRSTLSSSSGSPAQPQAHGGSNAAAGAGDATDPRWAGIDPALLAKVRAKEAARAAASGRLARHNVQASVDLHCRVVEHLYHMVTTHRKRSSVYLSEAVTFVAEAMGKSGAPASKETVTGALRLIAGGKVSQSWCSLSTLTVHAGTGLSGAVTSDSIADGPATSKQEVVRILKATTTAADIAAVKTAVDQYFKAA